MKETAEKVLKDKQIGVVTAEEAVAQMDPEARAGLEAVLAEEEVLPGEPDLIMPEGIADLKSQVSDYRQMMYGKPPKWARGRTAEPVRTERKVHRNEPCPCGSGKKYKKCCM